MIVQMFMTMYFIIIDVDTQSLNKIITYSQLPRNLTSYSNLSIKSSFFFCGFVKEPDTWKKVKKFDFLILFIFILFLFIYLLYFIILILYFLDFVFRLWLVFTFKFIIHIYFLCCCKTISQSQVYIQNNWSREK